jgi:hypothetical protein
VTVPGLAGLAVGVLAACSGSSSGVSSASSAAVPSSRPSASSAAPASPSASPLSAAGGVQNASADEILAQARSTLLGARSVHAKGVVKSGSTSYRLDLRMVRKVGAAGSVAGQGSTLGVIRIGKVAYIKLDPASWRAVTGSTTVARQFAGKYLKVTSSNGAAFKPFLALTDVDRAFSSLLLPTGTVGKGPVTTVNGKRVIDLQVNGGRTGHVFVALDGPPYPVRLAYGAGGGQRVDLDGYGRTVKLTAPPASKIASTG